MIRLSIIIPFYNVEKYIAQCLESVYNQDLPEDEYEVICVNDASPDRSRDIVQEYQKVHSNLILIEHEYNKKLGAARNTGRAIARGKYIWNVDSDDYIEKNCLSSILSECEKNDLDVLMFNLAIDIDNSIKIADFPYMKPHVTQDGLMYLNQNISYLGHFCAVWRFIYSRNFLERFFIVSPEINMGEDVPFAFKALLLAKKVLFTNRLCYYNRNNPTSLTAQSALKPTVLYEKCFLAARLVCEILQYVPKNNDELLIGFDNLIKNIIYVYPRYLVGMSKFDRKHFSHICRQNVFHDFCLFRIMNKQYKFGYIKCLLNF